MPVNTRRVAMTNRDSARPPRDADIAGTGKTMANAAPFGYGSGDRS
jgi:hypothetical protein